MPSEQNTDRAPIFPKPGDDPEYDRIYAEEAAAVDAEEARWADREKLGDIIDDWLTDPDHIDTGFLADAILNSEWMREHDERVRREAREGYVARRDVYDDEQMRKYVEAHMAQIIERVRREAAAEQREKDAAKLNAISVQTFVSANGLDDVTWGQLMRRAAAFDDAAAAIREQGNDA